MDVGKSRVLRNHPSVVSTLPSDSVSQCLKLTIITESLNHLAHVDV